MRLGTYCSGGGLFEIGAMAAGVSPVFGVEYDPKIAHWHKVNIPDCQLHVSDVCTIDPSLLPYVDWFHNSPSCINFSVANNNGVESSEDVRVAQATADYITTHKPHIVTVENVWQYRNSDAFVIILKALQESGYGWRFDHINMANYGVPQRRKRLILMAIRGKRPTRIPHTHAEYIAQGLFVNNLEKWVGWYEAVEDLIPTLPNSEFADWQKDIVKKHLGKTFLISGGNPNGGGRYIRTAAQPALTVAGSHHLAATRIMLGARQRTPVINDTLPALTVTSSDNQAHSIKILVSGGDSKSPPRNDGQPSFTIVGSQANVSGLRFTSHGRIVKASTRCLARWQSVPDWYQIPTNKSLACKIVGNGVPSLFAQKLGEHLAA